MIIPAILEKTVEGFEEKFSKIKQLAGVERLQVDFADSIFVDNLTLNIDQLPELDAKYQWEAHLMVQAPEDLAAYKAKGFSKIVVHYEAFLSEENLEQALQEITKLGVTPAIALNPETPISVMRYFADTITNFTLMGIEPGAQGKEFIPLTFERIAELRQLAPNATIQVDGGVRVENARTISQAGSNDLVVGSALLTAEDIQQVYQDLLAETKS